MSIFNKLFGKGTSEEPEPKNRKEAIEKLVGMSNREFRRHYFKKWHKKFVLDWSDIKEKVKK